MRILVVDDAAELRTLVRTLLASAQGLVIEEAATGEEAIATTTRAPPDLIIMDQQLPGISGSEATREIKRLAPAVEVIGFTASPEAEADLLAAGATRHFSKLEFAAMIEYVVNRAPRPPGST